MKSSVFAVAALLVCAFVPAMAQEDGPRPEVIYGDDDRLDLYEVHNKKLLVLADSTVGLFNSGNVSIDETKTARLTTRAYSDDYNLCAEEPFYDQRTGAFCSGSLVGPDILMTAGHCITSEYSCKGTKFVFGFGIREKESSRTRSRPAKSTAAASSLGASSRTRGPIGPSSSSTARWSATSLSASAAPGPSRTGPRSWSSDTRPDFPPRSREGPR